ncbi:glycosyl hydrolase [Paenibacillus sp. LPE1-1-1.1]|uniref:glycosyl hydrolase n=1 Tax=Paenibacillus sp. LPE1-1-1.1 TaxID=3135230 RepID=UPI00343174AB
MNRNRNQLKQSFMDPGIPFRPVPFWAWNDDLKQEELDRQIDGFKEQGMGGFMMHVREGLETPYLSDEFMERIKGSVTKAKESGMKAWLYDEDRYSSGMGGGLVPKAGGDAVRAKALTLSLSQSMESGDASIVAAYKAVIKGDQITELSRLVPDKGGNRLYGSSETYLVFRVRIAAKNDWCHGDTYTDLMNPETARLFIEKNYEPYRKAVGEEFGRTVPGIFTDEPTVKGFSERLEEPELTWIAWSEVLASEFERRRGYSIWELLPFFFFGGKASAQIRHDYWLTVAETFGESYTKQIGDWCREQGVQFTGHFHSEGSIVGQVQHSGSLMLHYRYMDIPGVDTLCEQTAEHLTIKQVSSIANQLGKKRVITETYGVTGWDLTFENRRWIGDWQYALGVNLLTHHLSWYSLRGCRKRDYPPSFNYHTNWWNHNRKMEDYYARLSAVLSEGKLTRNVLVVHPSTSVWTKLGQSVHSAAWKNNAGNETLLADYDKSFNSFVNRLVELHIDYDLGDELIMKEFARADEERLIVGEASYEFVIFPSLHNLMSSTVEVLLAYMNGGGKVAAFGAMPSLLDGRSENLHRLEELLDHKWFIRLQDADELEPLLNGTASRAVSIKDENGLEAKPFLHMHRQMNGCTVAFIVNNDRDNGHQVEIRLSGGQSLEEWDVWTGKVITRSVRLEEGGVAFKENFEPAQSKLYVIGNDLSGQMEQLADSETELDCSRNKQATELKPVSFQRTAPNVLILDQCQFRMKEEQWSEPMEVWRAQRIIRERLGMRQVLHSGNLQRYFWIHEEHPGNETPFELRFTFTAAEVPSNDTYFVFEDAHRFDFELNGRRIDAEPDGYYLDVSMKKVKLPTLREGVNTLDVFIAYCNDMELENGYIIGDFAVDSYRRIVDEPSNLSYGDWRSQGYPYYCGSMNYCFEIEKETNAGNGYSLVFGRYEAVLMDVKVNGAACKMIPWRCEAYVDLDPFLVTDGENRVVIEVVGSPRNLFGPLHQLDTNPKWMDWWSFHPEDNDYTTEYRGTPYGLIDPVRLLRSSK